MVRRGEPSPRDLRYQIVIDLRPFLALFCLLALGHSPFVLLHFTHTAGINLHGEVGPR